MGLMEELSKNHGPTAGNVLKVIFETASGSFVQMSCADNVGVKLFLEAKDHMLKELRMNPELLPADTVISLQNGLSTREAFRELINQRNIGKVLGLKSQRVRDIRLEIKNDVWPSTDTMEEYLLKSGYKVKQEKLWEL